VRFHEGYLTQREARQADAKTRKGKTKDAKAETTEPRSPITAAMRNYLDLHRHAVVRLAILKHPKDALKLLIAHAVAASGNWNVNADPQRADNTAVRDSIAASAAQTAFAAEAKKVRALLAPAFKGESFEESDGAVRVVARHGDDALTVRVFQRLLKLRDADVLRIAAFVMAETLQSGSNVVDAFGTHAKVKPRDHWRPEDTFFALLRDRQTVGAMLTEVAGKKAADKLVTAKLKDSKAALAKAASEAPTWCPGWMAFPASE